MKIIHHFGDKSVFSNSAEIGERVALFALCFFVSTAIAFRFSTAGETFPILVNLNIIGICEIVSCVLAIAAIAIRPRKFPVWRSVFLAMVLVVLLISANRLFNYRYVIECLVLISVAGISMKRICKSYCAAVLAAFLPILLLSITGLLYNMDTIPNSRLVFAYGFVHPNTPGAILFSVIAAMAYVIWDRKVWVVAPFLAAASAAFAYFTLSSHASAVILALLAVAIVAGHQKGVSRALIEHKRIVASVLIAVPCMALGIMLICTAFYDGHNYIFRWLNDLLHSRPYFAHQYYVAQGGFSLLGTPGTFTISYHTGLQFSGVDSGYCHLALFEGLFVLGSFLSIYIIAVLLLSKNAIHPLVAAIFLINALFLMVEGCSLLLPESSALLFISIVYSGDTYLVGFDGGMDNLLRKES